MLNKYLKKNFKQTPLCIYSPVLILNILRFTILIINN